MFKYKKDHLYKQCKFAPSWGGHTDLQNWKIHEIVNKSHSYEEAYSACDASTFEVDSIINDNLLSYFKPEIKTYGELNEHK